MADDDLNPAAEELGKYLQEMVKMFADAMEGGDEDDYPILDGESEDLGEVYDQAAGEAFPEDFDELETLGQALREVLDEQYADAAGEDLEHAVLGLMEEMDPAEGLSFTKALKVIGDAGQKVITDPSLGQYAGMGIGTVIGGPAGAAIGGKVGQTAVGAIRGKPAAAPPPAPAPKPATPPTAPAAQAANPASTAAGQAAVLAVNNNLLTALLAAALGNDGRKTIPIGPDQSQIPVGALINLLAEKARQAAEEVEQSFADGAESEAYLMDGEGNYIYDPADPLERADALYRMLMEAEDYRLFGETAVPAASWFSSFPFGKGARLKVEYDSLVNLDIGKAWVLEHTPNLLRLKIHIDRSKTFNLPETEVVIGVEYRQEGPGNRAAVAVNGSVFTDGNLIIQSGPNTRLLIMSINLLGQAVDKITLIKDGANRARIKFRTLGSEYALILSRD